MRRSHESVSNIARTIAGDTASVRVAAVGVQRETKVLAELPDGAAVLRVGITVGESDDDRRERATIPARRREHRGDGRYTGMPRWMCAFNPIFCSMNAPDRGGT